MPTRCHRQAGEAVNVRFRPFNLLQCFAVQYIVLAACRMAHMPTAGRIMMAILFATLYQFMVGPIMESDEDED
jgi:hypothetical protein